MDIEKAKEQEKELQKNVANANYIKEEIANQLYKANQDKLNIELLIKKN